MNIGPDGCAPQGQITNIYQFSDNFSWTKGRHQMKAGAEFRNVISPSIFLPRQRGEYNYTTLAEFLSDDKPAGGGNGALRGIGSAIFAVNFQSYFWFIQDDIKLKPNLTLNLGLRYEYVGNARDMALQDFNSIADVDANDPGLIAARNLFRRPEFFAEGIHFREPETDKNNYGPRLGIAWSPNYQSGWLHKIFGDQGQSSVRAGYTLAYDFFFQNLSTLQLPPQFQSEIDANGGSGGFFGSDTRFLENGGIPNAGAGLPSELFTDTALARLLTQAYIFDMVTPYTQAWTLSFQREFAKNWAIELRYLGNHASHLYAQIRQNGGVDVTHHLGQFLPTFFNASEVPSLNQRNNMRTLGDLQALQKTALEDLGFAGGVTAFEQLGSSFYHGFATNVKHRFSQGFLLDASYTWSHTIDDNTNELFTSFLNPRRPEDGLTGYGRERSTSALDRTHRFVTGLVWELPFGDGRAYLNQNKILSSIVGGWTVSGIYQIESGQPVTVQSGVDSNLNFDGAGDRSIINPNGAEGVGTTVSPILNSDGDIVGYLADNPNAQYVQAGAGARTNAGRNTLRLPRLNNLDLTVSRHFRITEGSRLSFRADFFNALNHAQFLPLGLATNGASVFAQNATDGSSQAFVTLGTPFFNNPEGAFSSSPRTIQFSLKYSF